MSLSNAVNGPKHPQSTGIRERVRESFRCCDGMKETLVHEYHVYDGAETQMLLTWC